MLEKDRLILAPWHDDARIIADGEGREAATLGRAVTSGGVSWSTLFRGRTMEVFETDDASLLMTIQLPAGVFRMWQVADAEGNRVGSIYRLHLFDALGYRLARGVTNTGHGSFRDLAGKELASWNRLQDGSTLLHFGGDSAGNPFMRMVLLAGVLTLPAIPGG